MCAHTYTYIYIFLSSTSLSSIPKSFAHPFDKNTNLNFK
jgi:hypothetical protein